LALPLLQAGKSLRFAVMPQGQDPDDLIRQDGPGAMQRLLDNAKPMVELLWEREVHGKNFDSPERKAALDKTLREKLNLIKDPSIRGHYGQALKSLRWELFRLKSKTQKFKVWGRQSISPLATTRSSSLVVSDENSHVLRQSVILATLLKAPEALASVETQLEDLQFLKSEHRKIQQFLLQYSGDLEQLWQTAEQTFGVQKLEDLLSLPHVSIAPSIRNCGDIELVVTCLLQEFAQIFAVDAHGREVAEAVQDQSDLDDEGLTWRLNESVKHVQETLQGGQDDKTEYRTASNGLKLKLEEQDKLKNLLEKINFSKPDTK
jgi:DNA primase